MIKLRRGTKTPPNTGSIGAESRESRKWIVNKSRSLGLTPLKHGRDREATRNKV